MIYASVQKYFREIYFLLVAVLGLAFGSLLATIAGNLLEPPPATTQGFKPTSTKSTPPPELKDFDIILQRNLFQAAVGGATIAETAAPKTGATRTAPRLTNLSLVGVVVAGDSSLAVIRSGKDEKIYRFGTAVPGNGTLDSIERHQITIAYADGSQTILPLHKEAAIPTATKTPSASEGSTIKAVGDNRWVIPRAEANQARGNLNELLKQARMEPLINNGRTDGFVVKMIRPRSLLALLGIQKGDLLKSVNGMALDGPEKALQIFQQLREANNITIDLMRRGTPHTFEYAID